MNNTKETDWLNTDVWEGSTFLGKKDQFGNFLQVSKHTEGACPVQNLGILYNCENWTFLSLQEDADHVKPVCIKKRQCRSVCCPGLWDHEMYKWAKLQLRVL